jgi:hypothetical protein
LEEIQDLRFEEEWPEEHFLELGGIQLYPPVYWELLHLDRDDLEWVDLVE